MGRLLLDIRGKKRAGASRETNKTAIRRPKMFCHREKKTREKHLKAKRVEIQNDFCSVGPQCLFVFENGCQPIYFYIQEENNNNKVQRAIA